MPLDGGRVVQAALWRATGDRWCGWHVAAMLGIALGCVLVLAACVALLRGEAATGALLGFNASMVLFPAWSACGPFAVYRRLQRTLVTDHLGAPETMLRDTQSIEEANADVFVQRPASCHHPVLDGDGRLLGLVHRPAVNAALGRGHGHLPLLHLMILPGLDPVLVVCPGDATVGAVLEERHLDDAAELAAVDGDGRLLGMTSWKAIQEKAG